MKLPTKKGLSITQHPSRITICYVVKLTDDLASYALNSITWII